MPELEIKWSIEAPMDTLLGAAASAGINLNALVPGAIDGELIYPSFFCTSRTSWTKALAYLYVRNLEFRLYLFAMTEVGSEQWRYRLHPGMDARMMALMREIDEKEAFELELLQDRIGEVADRLRKFSLENGEIEN